MSKRKVSEATVKRLQQYTIASVYELAFKEAKRYKEEVAGLERRVALLERSIQVLQKAAMEAPPQEFVFESPWGK